MLFRWDFMGSFSRLFPFGIPKAQKYVDLVDFEMSRSQSMSKQNEQKGGAGRGPIDPIDRSPRTDVHLTRV